MPRTDIFVTTSLGSSPSLIERAKGFAAELDAEYKARRHNPLPELFDTFPDAMRALVVQSDRLALVARSGETLFYHPSLAFLRLGNILRGFRDLLPDAAQLQPGDWVLDATLGYASEAVVCAHFVGDTGVVHGIESVKELGIVVREGLQILETNTPSLNTAMRRVRVVHLGHHLDYLHGCETGSYDVVCFDPFFDEMLIDSQPIAPLRLFGDLSPLLPEAIAEARRVAKRCVTIKSERHVDMLAKYGAETIVESRSGKVLYGVLDGSG